MLWTDSREEAESHAGTFPSSPLPSLPNRERGAAHPAAAAAGLSGWHGWRLPSLLLFRVRHSATSTEKIIGSIWLNYATASTSEL